MTMKIEKQNGLFHRVIELAKGIKDKGKIKMFLYRFSSGMNATLIKDAHGIHHFKYIEKPKGSLLLAF